ncbi:MAG TPA: BamA/TamA family outer membrane protein [Gemmatimonadales bacterium]|nr:BamA/TamA family outer membrane protein [Gemmatimonadales bacterium]
MRALIVALCGALGPALAGAQDTAIVIQPESAEVLLPPQALPRLIAEEVIRFYNAPTTTRLVGRSRLPHGNEWHGDVAVRDGTVWLGGRVQGTLLVINGFALLDSTAAITGDLIVVGGAVTRAPGATVGGEVRTYHSPLDYRIAGDQIALAPPNPRRWFRRLGVEKSWGSADSRSSLTLATGGTFNRVEGLPIVFGPVFDWKLRQNERLGVDALGVFRTAGDLTDTRSDLGYMLRVELRSGEVPAYGVQVRAYDVVAPIEDWGLRAGEVGWEAFLFQHDYRDYYLNQGVAGRLLFQPERALSLAFEVRREWQTSIGARDPWTVFSTDRGWRPNPPIDDGHYTIFSGLVTLDTRNDRSQPTAGWYGRAQLETAHSSDVSPQTGVPTAVRPAIPTDGSYRFTRVFFDVRRYTRVSPSGRVNLRVLAGGWLGGDALPLQQRLSMGGPDPLTGYGFRHTACNRDIIAPAFAGSLVAACDRVILTQVEYRGHIALHWAYGAARPEDEQAKSLFSLQGPDLVVLGDAGQAWLVGSGPGRLPSDRLPTLGSWLADLGLGIDWSGLGVYVAKAVTAGEHLRFALRLDHRF